MSVRTPYEAVVRFVDPLQLALSCVTRSTLNVSGGYYISDRPHTLVLADGSSLRLPGLTRLVFKMTMYYQIVEVAVPNAGWDVAITSYMYSLRETPQQEIIAYY